MRQTKLLITSNASLNLKYNSRSLMSHSPVSFQKRQVILYTRPGCHLCDEAKLAMQAADCDNEYTLQEINIESDRELLRRYQCDIPVITIDGVESFRHKLTSQEFRKRLRSQAGASPPSRPRGNYH
jgi:glutaredoxin